MKVLFSTSLAVLFFSQFATADNLVLKADKWCPYTCSSTGGAQGYMVDIAKKIFKDSGHTVEYKVMAWADAVKQAENGEINGVIGGSVFDLPSGLRTEETLGVNNECFFALAKSTFTYTGPDSLKGKKIGTVKDYSYTDKVDAFFKANPASTVPSGGDYPLTDNLSNLKNGTVDVVIENESVYNYAMALKSTAKDYKKVGCSPVDYLYIIFSPKNPKSPEYVKILQDGIVKLRKSGELATILKNYRMVDWK